MAMLIKSTVSLLARRPFISTGTFVTSNSRELIGHLDGMLLENNRSGRFLGGLYYIIYDTIVYR